MSIPSPLLCSAWVNLSRIAVPLGFSTLTECDMSNGDWRNSRSVLARGEAAKPSQVSLVKPRCPSSIRRLTSSSSQAEPSHTASLKSHPKRYWHSLIHITSYTHGHSFPKPRPIVISTVKVKKHHKDKAWHTTAPLMPQRMSSQPEDKRGHGVLSFIMHI